MKIKRRKDSKRRLTFYRNYFDIRPPYKLLVDGTFCAHALRNKINIRDQVPKYLADEVQLLTSECVLAETEKIGPAVRGAWLILKQFELQKCGHKTPILARNCLKSLIGKVNPKHFIVATQDLTLKEELTSVYGCPLLTFKSRVMALEKPSKDAQDYVAKRLHRDQKEEVKQFKDPQDGAVRKRKRTGGPNPLSMKKKKIKPTPKPSTEDGKPKRKRVKKKKASKVIEFIRQAGLGMITADGSLKLPGGGRSTEATSSGGTDKGTSSGNSGGGSGRKTGDSGSP